MYEGGGGGASSPLGPGEDKMLVCILENYKVCRRLHKEEGGWMVRPPGGF